MTPLTLHVDHPAWKQMSKNDRDQIREWLVDNGIDPVKIKGITLGEGHVVAEQHVHDSDDRIVISNGQIATETRAYPVSGLPPVWPSVEVL